MSENNQPTPPPPQSSSGSSFNKNRRSPRHGKSSNNMAENSQPPPQSSSGSSFNKSRSSPPRREESSRRTHRSIHGYNNKNKNNSKSQRTRSRKPFGGVNRTASGSCSGRNKNKNDSHQRTTNEDCYDSLQLEQAIRDLSCYDQDDTKHRIFAIQHLEKMLARWCEQVHNASEASNVPSFAAVAAAAGRTTAATKSFAAAAAAGNPWQQSRISSATPPTTATTAALIPFGSYRLGVHSNTSDLDLLALAPPTVQRSDFFSSLVTILQNDELVQQVHPIPTAYTPVIKFVINCHIDKVEKSLEVDLVFARVTDATKLVEYQRQKKMGKDDVQYVLDDSDLQDLDEAGVRSLNGARVSQMLLESVPNVARFQTVLRAVKQWAVAQGIYSNVMGFLGGVNWAILTAHVCQNYPYATSAELLRKFFFTYSHWTWNKPVMLDDIADEPPITNVSLQTRAVQLPAWNPLKNPRDGLHVMPIITPAYPSMNSSYNVDYPQLRRIQDEMFRASNFLSQHHERSNYYNSLFKPSDFFARHKHFLQITISAGSDQDFVEWFRLVESRIRVLISNLETQEVHAWPFAKFFGDGLERSIFIGLRFAPHIDYINVKHLTMDFLYKVNSWDGRKAGMDLCLLHVLNHLLPRYVWTEMHAKDAGSVSTDNTAPPTDDEAEDDDDYDDCASFQSATPTVCTTGTIESPPTKYRVFELSVGSSNPHERPAATSS